MENLKTIYASTILTASGLIAFYLSGFSTEHIYSIISKPELLLNINPFLFFGSIILMIIGVSTLSLQQIQNENYSFPLLVPVAINILVLISLFGANYYTILTSITAPLSILYLLYSSKKQKEEYKKINSYRISTSSLAIVLTLVTVSLALSVYLDTKDNTVMAREQVDTLLQKTVHLSIGELDNIQNSIKEQEINYSYNLVDVIEAGMLNTLNMQYQQNIIDYNCLSTINNNIKEIDKSVKEQVRNSLNNQDEDNMQIEQLNSLKNLIEKIINHYAIILALLWLSIFTTIKSVTFLLSQPFIYLLSKLYSSSTKNKNKQDSAPANSTLTEYNNQNKTYNDEDYYGY